MSRFVGRKAIDRRRKKVTENVSVGPAELGLRGNQEFLTLMLNPNAAVLLGCAWV